MVFQKVLMIEDSLPIPLYAQYHFLWIKPAFGLVGGSLFHLPHTLFHSTLLYTIHFSSSVTICFKKQNISVMFQKRITCENMVKKVFSLNLCGTQTSKWLIYQLGVNDFQHRFGYSEYVNNLLYGITLIILNLCLDLIIITLDLSLQPWNIRQWEKKSGQNFTNHFWYIWLVTAPSQYTAQIFSCVFKLHFYLSWNNKASCAKNVAFFLHLQY